MSGQLNQSFRNKNRNNFFVKCSFIRYTSFVNIYSMVRKMPLISESEAVQQLQVYLEPIRSIIQGGWDDYNDSYKSEHKIIHCSSTRASIIHDHHITRASKFALETGGVHLVDFAKMKVIFIENRFAIRFKKFNTDKKSSNQPTQQVKEFRFQRQLSGMPQTYNLEAGYILNPLETELSSISIVCPNGGGIHWDINLTETDEALKVYGMFDNVPVENEDEGSGVIIHDKEAQKEKGIILPFNRETDHED